MIDISRNPKNEEVSSMWWEDLLLFLSSSHETKDGRGRLFNGTSTYREAAIEKAKATIIGGNNLSVEVGHYLNNFLKKDELKDYVLCKAENLEEKINKYTEERHDPTFTAALAYGMIYLYNSFTTKELENGDTEAAKIMDSLGINTCPYCNREYTFTLYGKAKKTRPEFDHFYNKTDYPILALSFYNLVPSCHVCNHIKGTNDVKVNPYVRGFRGKLHILGNDKLLDRETLAPLSKDDIDIKFEECDTDEKVNIEKLGLDNLYEQHKDYVKDLIDKVYAYDHDSREYLADAFQGKSEMPSEVYNFVWGTYLGAMQDNNWPLAKLTRDVLEQLGIGK